MKALHSTSSDIKVPISTAPGSVFTAHGSVFAVQGSVFATQGTESAAKGSVSTSQGPTAQGSVFASAIGQESERMADGSIGRLQTNVHQNIK